jgi:hypothetical protein
VHALEQGWIAMAEVEGVLVGQARQMAGQRSHQRVGVRGRPGVRRVEVLV